MNRYLALLYLGVLLLAGCAIQSGTSAFDRQRCTRLYVQGLYPYHQVIHHPRDVTRLQGPWDEPRDGVDGQDVRLGAGFAIRHGDRRLLVTAAHLFPAPPEVNAIVRSHVPGDDVTVDPKGIKTKVCVSALVFAPTRVYVNRENDVTFLDMPPAFWQTTDMQVFDLDEAAPARLSASVQAWGFPSTSVPQVKSKLVTSIGSPLLMLNEPSDPGFSGGPVVDGNTQQLVGIVLRSTGSQTACLPAAMIKDLAGRFEQTAEAYVEP